MATVHQGLGDHFGGAPAPSLARRPRRGGVKVASGLPWILPALVLCVGLLYYCIGYTGLISTWNWDGINPHPQHVGFGNYTQLFHDPLFWGAVRHTVVFFVVTFMVQTFLGLMFAVLLHSRIRLAVVYKVIIFVPVVLAPAIMAPVFRAMLAPGGQFNEVLQHVGLGSLAQPWIGQTSTALPALDGDHHLAVHRLHIRPLLRGDEPDRPVGPRGRTPRRSGQLQRHYSASSGPALPGRRSPSPPSA